MSFRIRVSNPAVCLFQFDDPLMWPKLVREQRKGYEWITFTKEQLVSAIEDATDRGFSMGWDNDNNGAAMSCARAFLRSARAALQGEGK